MAEFIEVARAKRRMCKAHTEECSECKLQRNCSLLNVCAYSDDDVINFENEVMAWAAEHPEPVYPTWWEWLFSIGAVTRKVKPDVAATLIDTGLLDYIPADMAEKLGIEPKEK